MSLHLGKRRWMVCAGQNERRHLLPCARAENARWQAVPVSRVGSVPVTAEEIELQFGMEVGAAIYAIEDVLDVLDPIVDDVRRLEVDVVLNLVGFFVAEKNSLAGNTRPAIKVILLEPFPCFRFEIRKNPRDSIHHRAKPSTKF